MIKKAVSILLISFLCQPPAHARIGASIEDFKNSSFAIAETFTLRDSYRITDDPVYQGKYAYNFFTPDQRYKIQLIADKKGTRIIFEYLMYPAADDQMIALKDGSIALSFVAQASGEAVASEQFVSLIAEANRGSRNIKYTRQMSGYTVAVTRFDTDVLTGWSIGVRK